MQNFSGWIAEEWTAREKLARRRDVRLGGVIGAVCAGVGIASWWGFTVDDAWIIARIAASIAAEQGHRFNSGGAPVDAVTPFGFSWLLAMLSPASPLAAFALARWLGVIAHVIAATVMGMRLGALGTAPSRFLALAWFGIFSPIAPWCAAGMETPLIVLLVVLGSGTGRRHAAALGLAAAWRPELLPLAICLALGAAWVRGRGPGGGLQRLGLVLAPALTVAMLRQTLFGASYPLAVLAKPAELNHGLRYAIGGLVFSGSAAMLSMGAGRHLGRWARVRMVAVAAHALALTLAGGDWMPLFRLWAPALPVVLWIAAEGCERVSPRRRAGLWLAAALCGALPVWQQLWDARAVEHRRLALVEEARPLLQGAEHVAALDVGWVGLATAAEVVDLAGVTDPEVARLAGGHTSKRLPPDFARRRRLDAAVVLVDSGSTAPQIAPGLATRAVEQRLIAQLLPLGFSLRGVVPLSGTTQSYAVLRRDAGKDGG